MRIKLEFAEGDAVLSLEEVLGRVETAYLKLVVNSYELRAEAAQALGISRKNLWERLRKRSIEPALTPDLTLRRSASIEA
jgi:transcriptional regulator with PAS, ATPase and Fis domain